MSTTIEHTQQPSVAVVRDPTILERLAGLEATAARLAADRDAANLRAARAAEERDAASNRADRAEAWGLAMRNEVFALTGRVAELVQRAAEAEAIAERALATAAREKTTRLRVDAENSILRAQPSRPPRTVKRRPWRTRRH